MSRVNSPIGSLVGSKDRLGYLVLNWQGVNYYVHRVAWALHNNEQPKEIDHIDGDKSNNSIENIRSVTRSENIMNNVTRSWQPKKCSW